MTHVFAVTVVFSPYKEYISSRDIWSRVFTTHDAAKKALYKYCRREYKETNGIQADDKKYFYVSESGNSIQFGDNFDRSGYYSEYGFGMIEKVELVDEQVEQSEYETSEDEESNSSCDG